jgi:polysaccharide biosynthesis transport protein
MAATTPSQPNQVQRSATHPAPLSVRPESTLPANWAGLLARSWCVTLGLGVAAFLGALHLHRAPRLYSASATVQVEQREQPMAIMDRAQPEDLRSLEVMQTIAASLKSRSVLERVLATNRLTSDPRFARALAPGAGPAQFYQALDRAITARLRRGTRLIDVTAVHPSAPLAELIANSVTREFMAQNAEQHAAANRSANEFLIDEAQRLKRQLLEAEQAVQVDRETTGVVSLDKEQDTVVAKLKELNLKVTEAKAARILAETVAAQVESAGTNLPALLTLPIVAQHPRVAEAQLAVDRAESALAAVSERYKAKHPQYAQAVSLVAQRRGALALAVQEGCSLARVSAAKAKAIERALESALRQQEATALELGQLSIQHGALAREAEADRVLYEAVLTRLKEGAITREPPPPQVRVIQPAYLPETPFSPKTSNIILITLIAGVAAGILLALGLNALDHSLKTADQVETTLHQPVLSVVPQLRGLRPGGGRLVVLQEVDSLGTEAFRTLRTSLAVLGRPQPHRVLLFTSSLPKEGKTFCSVNCACSLAQQGLRTLIIDGDLRRPGIEDYLLGQDRTRPGVTDYLAGQRTFEEVVRTTKLENLSYIPAGSQTRKPAELLAQGRFDALVGEAAKRFDRVVIDTAPLLPVSDSLLMLPRADLVCLVARSYKTPLPTLTRCLQTLCVAGAPVAGIILNRMPKREAGGYYSAAAAVS